MDLHFKRVMNFSFTLMLSFDVGGPSVVRSLSVQPTDEQSSPLEYVISWHTPHDGGMPIRYYLLRYRQVINSDITWRR